MIIVSNTGPLIGLAKIQQLGLLGRLAAEVYIPPQVHPLLGTLRSSGYWVSDELVAVVKNLAGE